MKWLSYSRIDAHSCNIFSAKGSIYPLIHIACNKNILVLLSRGNSKEERRTWVKRILPYEIQGSGVILENLNKHYIITMSLSHIEVLTSKIQPCFACQFHNYTRKICLKGQTCSSYILLLSSDFVFQPFSYKSTTSSKHSQWHKSRIT